MKRSTLLCLIIGMMLSLQGCFAFLAGSAVVAAASVATTAVITAVRVPIIVGETIIDVAFDDEEAIPEQEEKQIANSELDNEKES